MKKSVDHLKTPEPQNQEEALADHAAVGQQPTPRNHLCTQPENRPAEQLPTSEKDLPKRK